ncbi:unnamed protein product [Paramecium sonneborni]|uniref:Cyclic nucleotide-binding domain-containing protein n=1 Tax=Paramecium sonneborni TaxID=65129 RepID=A0A8S1P3L7_9CILI|nr:unnamed protein product [Paramecium sonneborni]
MQVLIHALQNYPDPLKRPNEIKVQISEALEQIKFFAEFLRSEKIKQNARHLLLEFSNYLSLEIFKSGEIICREGDKGDKFYIILQGNVVVYRKNINSNYEQNSTMSEQIFMDQNVKIGQLKEGETFGELALSLNKPRFATIKAQSFQVILCSLSKDNYAKMTNYMQRELNLKTNALATLFPKLSQNSLIRLAYLLQIQIFPKNHCIYKQGETATGFYILSDGEVKLEQICKNSTQIYVPIMVLTPGSLFGVQNVLKNQPYDNQAICITQKVTVYKFTCESFEQLGDDYSKKALQSAERTFRREPKIQSLQLICKPEIKLDEQNKQNPKKQRTIKSNGKQQEKFRKPKTDIVQNQITFRNPFFSDLDAEKFKQIKKISIEQIKQADLKKYNQQFAIKNYFEPIEIAPMLDSIKKQKNAKCLSFASVRENTATQTSMYSYPASGFNTQRVFTLPSPSHTRHTSHSKKSRL